MKTQTAHPSFLALLGLLCAAALLLTAPLAGATAGTEIKLGDSCVTAECHGDIKNIEFLHGPVNLMQCEPCHIPVENRHEFKPTAKGRELCVTCHEVEAAKQFVHGPFQADCTLCHQPHGGNNRHFVKGGEGAESCKLCHDDVTKGKTHLHGPVAMGECLACHSPHQSDNKGLLVEPRTQLCLGCHIDVGVAMKNAISVHKPVEESCEGCHDPHGGTAEFFLPSEGSDLCMKCHGEFIEKSHQAAFPHAPMTEGKGCRNCHSPHASSQQRLLSTTTADLCLGCHNQEIHRGDKNIDNVAAQLADAKSLHGPIREKNCVACHQAHGSETASILRKPYPRDFYAPYKEGAYDLCFECHDRTLVKDAKSEATGFRDGDRNLHFLHVNREKGRTCRACHAEHASTQDNHIRTEVPFGRWAMKVDFTKVETGGTCETGCHVPKSYDRVKPVKATETK
jgi:predicted CXXCH cytochrome family protein